MKIQSFKSISTLFIAVALAVLMGCPYHSNVPITTEGIKVPVWLIGTWTTESDTEYTYTITKTGERQARLSKVNNADQSSEDYAATFSEVNGTLFMNLQGSFGDGFDLYKIEKRSETQIVVFELTENIREQFESSEDLRDFISRNMQNSYFFTTGESTYNKGK